MPIDRVKEAFRDPSSDWRGAPFWSWNDDLEPAELRRQVREMRAAGLGGFFMHSRVGLVTRFMGEEWMECVAAAVAEARRQGMKAWLYDEDKWPSGYGGGMVVNQNPEWAARYLELRPRGSAGDHRFAVRRKEGQVWVYRKLGPWEQAAPDEEVQEFRIASAPPTAWFNNSPYIDTMNPGAVKAFIKLCYEPYRKRLAKYFGNVIPGIFTDEPNFSSLGNLPPAPRVPWTDRLPAEFRRRRGYDLLVRLPELFSGRSDFAQTRHDFWRTLTELFAEAYCKQLGAWCEKQGLELTGHMLCEQEFEQEIPVGGAAMPNLAYMHRPGIDILTEQAREVLTCKQASSVAHQMGRKRTLSETYGTTGWHFTFEAQKWSGDWQTVLGINTRCQHLTPYSLRGMRKRDYPPTFSWHQPWWEYFRTVEDYFARACFFTTLGGPVREVLLLHNISTAWADSPDDETRSRHGEHLNQVAEDLLALHYDFDLADEIMLAEHGDVKSRRLAVGKASYRILVVPEADSIFRTTADLLRRFLEAGGKVICMRRRPKLIEGKHASELDGLFSHPNVVAIAAKRGELEDALRANLPRRVSIAGESGRQAGDVIYQERTHQGRTYLMLANRHRQTGQRLTVELAGKGGVEQWDLETGAIRRLPARASGDSTVITLDLPPAGSAALVLDPKGKPSAARPRPISVAREIALKPEWQVRRSTENGLPLDSCQWRFARGKWSKPTPVFVAQAEIRSSMGLADISHSGIPQPWVRYAEPSEVPPRPVELRFAFGISALPASGLDLVLESAELFDIFVNGQPVPNQKCGWWLDKSMDRVRLSHLQLGENELVLRCDYRDAPEYELEECYLIGDFGVDRASDAIIAEPTSIRAGDWCDQGYPYYAGNLYYGQDVNLRRQSGERAILKVGPHFAACLAVHVNGRRAGVRGWAPYEVDVTRYIQNGKNRIEIEVCGSPRNLLGPNHLDEKRPGWTGPNEFIRLDRWVDRRNLVPYGLFGEVTLAVMRRAGRD